MVLLNAGLGAFLPDKFAFLRVMYDFMTTTQTQIPLVSPMVGEEEIEAVNRVLRSGQLAQGPETAAFEEEFAHVAGVKHAVAVNSGTAAIHAALAAAGVMRGDRVVTTPFTFAATATPILMQSGVPVFVDIDPQTFNADIAHLSEAVDEKTKAVIAVDLFGLPVDRAGIDQLKARGVTVIEDACQAVGASRDGRNAGAIGHAGCFSLYATKNIMTGEGGMLTTDDDAIAAAAKRFRQHGQGERYEYLSLGYNYRMTDLAAAIGRVQLSRLQFINDRRRENAAVYDKALAGVAGVRTPFVPSATTHVYHQYTILVDGAQTKNGANRDAVRGALNARGIGSGVYYPTPLHVNPLFKDFGFKAGDFPNAERAAQQVLALPIHPRITAEMAEEVAAAIREAVGV